MSTGGEPVGTSAALDDQPVPRKRLRLSVLLTEIYEEARAAEPVVVAAAPEVAEAERRRKRTPSNISIGEIMDRASHAGFGFMLGFIALVSIPFVGLSTPFGLAIAFGAIQMILGRHRPWLPHFVRRQRVSLETLDWLGRKLIRWTAWMERLVRPRFEFLAYGPFWLLCGIGVLVQGLALALPLPLPGTNWIFIFPIILYGIGLLENDGLLIMFCHAITVIQGVLAVVFWKIIYHALHVAFTNFFGWLALL